MTRYSLPIAFLALSLLSSACFAQTPAPPAQQSTTSPDTSITTFKTTTRLTVVDVTVTDAKGKPVHGLTESDFILKEDSKPQPLKNFQEYSTESPQPSSPPPALPPDTYTNQQATSPTSGALNIILIDDVSFGMKGGATPANVMYAVQQSQKYLDNLPAGTQVAILELADNLRIVQGFTTDQAALLTAIKSLSHKAPADIPFGICELVNNQNRRILNALNQTAVFVSGIRGRKNLIWFTPGIPFLTNYAYFTQPQFTWATCLHDSTPELHQTYSLLNASQVAIYPLDSQGLGGGSFINRSLEHESMQVVAEATGGVPYFNRNDLDAAIGEAISTGSDYYSLSYVPPIPKYDGKYHTIDVKLSRPGLHLQYRKGYTSVDASKLIASPGKPTDPSTPPAIAQFHKAMANGEPPSTQVLFTVRVAPSPPPNDPPVKGILNPTVKTKSLIRYNVVYALPGSQLTFLDDPSGARKTSLEFDIAAYDDEGKLLNVLRQTGNLAIKPENVAQIAQRTFQVPLHLDLPPGKLSVRIGILDVPSNKIGTLQVPITVSQN